MGRVRSVWVVVGMIALGACPAPSGTPAPPTPAGPAPQRGGTLRVLMAGDVDSLDPHRGARPSSWFFARALHRGLLAFPAVPSASAAAPVPDLAVALPTVDRGGTRYTFRLRDGIGFAERPLHARDVRRSLQRLIRDGEGIARSLDVVRAVRARGRDTVVIRLRRPAPDLSWILAHPQAAVLPAGSPAPGSGPPGDLNGLGPYRLARYRPQRSIVLERNERWGEDPVRAAYLDGIEASIGVGPRAAARRVARGAADLVLDDGPPDRGRVEIPADARVVTTASGCIRYLFLNRRVAPFDRRAARLAVAHAVPRSTLTGAAPSAAAGGLLPTGVVGHGDAPVVSQSPSRARAALARAGMAGGFDTELVVADAPRDRAEAAAIRRGLRGVGIEVQIRRVPPEALHRLYYERPSARVPMGIATWCADWPGLAGRNVLGRIADPRAVRDTEPNPVYASIRSRVVQRALDRATRASGPAADRRWATADRAVQRTGWLIPLTEPLEQVVVAPALGGLPAGAMWPRGDPTGLWLDPAVGENAG